MASRVLTVMFTDIKGFTERTSQSSREELHNILKEHEDLLPPILKKFGGTVVKTVGDAFMVTFESPTNAVLCGVMIQDRLFERNQDVPEEQRLEVRVAINSGEVVEREGDIFGEAVNIASRIEGITEASEIYFTEGVYLAMNKAEVPSSEVGVRRLKGIPESIKVYRVIQDRHSEQYQALLSRLRAEKFHDVAIPTTAQRGLTRFITRPGGKKQVALGGVVVAVVAAIVVALVVTSGGAPVKEPEPETPVVVTPPPPKVQSPEELEREKVVKDFAAVEAALGEGQAGLALARADAMLKDFPTHKESHDAVRLVVAAEVKALVERGKLEKAFELLDARKKNNREYIKFDVTERDLWLRWGAAWSAKGNYGITSNAYITLMDRWPDDMEILRAAVKYGGAPSKLKYTSGGARAAMKIAEKTEGPLDDDVGKTIAISLRRMDYTDEKAGRIRKLLAARYEPAVLLFREVLASDRDDERMNAFAFLKEKGELTADDELKLHVKNLTAMSPLGRSDRPTLQAAIDYIKAASAKPDWAARKTAIGLTKIEKIKGITSANELSDVMADLFAEAFADEIKDLMLEWVKGRYPGYRIRAYGLLPRIGLADEVDHWQYHKDFLFLDEFTYQYRYFHGAVAYFASHAEKDRSVDAKKMLTEARGAMGEWYDDLTDAKRRQVKTNYKANLKAVDEALAQFE